VNKKFSWFKHEFPEFELCLDLMKSPKNDNHVGSLSNLARVFSELRKEIEKMSQSTAPESYQTIFYETFQKTKENINDDYLKNTYRVKNESRWEDFINNFQLTNRFKKYMNRKTLIDANMKILEEELNVEFVFKQYIKNTRTEIFSSDFKSLFSNVTDVHYKDLVYLFNDVGQYIKSERNVGLFINNHQKETLRRAMRYFVNIFVSISDEPLKQFSSCVSYENLKENYNLPVNNVDGKIHYYENSSCFTFFLKSIPETLDSDTNALNANFLIKTKSCTELYKNFAALKNAINTKYGAPALYQVVIPEDEGKHEGGHRIKNKRKQTYKRTKKRNKKKQKQTHKKVKSAIKINNKYKEEVIDDKKYSKTRKNNKNVKFLSLKQK
jgi:hypothetical protein